MLKIPYCYLDNSHGKLLFLIFFAMSKFYAVGLKSFCYLICSMPLIDRDGPVDSLRVSERLMARKRLFGGILHTKSLRMLKERKAICYPFSFIVYNAKPVGHQVPNNV